MADIAWGIKRDDTIDETKVPLVDGGESVKLRSYDSRKL